MNSLTKNAVKFFIWFNVVVMAIAVCLFLRISTVAGQSMGYPASALFGIAIASAFTKSSKGMGFYGWLTSGMVIMCMLHISILMNFESANVIIPDSFLLLWEKSYQLAFGYLVVIMGFCLLVLTVGLVSLLISMMKNSKNKDVPSNKIQHT